MRSCRLELLSSELVLTFEKIRIVDVNNIKQNKNVIVLRWQKKTESLKPAIYTRLKVLLMFDLSLALRNCKFIQK